MPLPALILPVLIAVAGAADSPITVRAFPWAPFISPMGEPFRGRGDDESPIARWFGRADQNRDGILTTDEMQIDAERFFARLDSDQDGQVGPEEIKTYEWEIAPEIQVNSNWKRPRGQPVPLASGPNSNRSLNDVWLQRKGDEHDGYRKDGLQGAARYGLLNIPQPVASADADFNRAITLIEFRQTASYRFKLLDTNGKGRITLPELEARLPLRPEGRRAKPGKNTVDPRIGLPLPEGD